jgi:adenylate kinase family enzyme
MRAGAGYREPVPMLGPVDPLPCRPHRVLVAGTSGAGKTTTAARIAVILGVPHVEIDALFHGPNWTPRPCFEPDVRAFSAGPAWVTEWQYRAVRAHLADRADLLVWLDLPRWLVMRQLIRRTLARRMRRQQLWNGNIEPALWTVLTDREHIVRWAWNTHHKSHARVADLRRERPDLCIVRLCSRRQVARWLSGPLQTSVTACLRS